MSPAEDLVIDLGEARTETDLFSALALALDLPGSFDPTPPLAVLGDHLRGFGRVLLDNADALGPVIVHHLDTPLFRELDLWATLRRPLSLSFERRVLVEPLSPQECLDLLLRRIEEVHGERLPPGPSVARLAGLLDGLPLAVELAVSRLDVTDVGRLADALETRQLAVLTSGFTDTPGRHVSLGVAFDDAVAGLTDGERRIALSVAIASGGLGVEALPSIAAMSPADVDVSIARLRTMGLLRDSGARRARLLRVAAELLVERSDHALVAATRLQHARHFAEHARRSAALPDGVTETLRDDAENFRAALAHAHEHTPDDVVVLAITLHPLLLWRATRTEHLELLDRAAAHPSACRDPAQAARLDVCRAEALFEWEGPNADVADMVAAALERLAPDDLLWRARALLLRAKHAEWAGDPTFDSVMRELGTLSEQAGDPVLTATVLALEARHVYYEKRVVALELLTRALAALPPNGARETRATILRDMALVHAVHGDAELGRTLARDALAIRRETRSSRDWMQLEHILAAASWEIGDVESARRHHAVAVEHARFSSSRHSLGFMHGYQGLCELAWGDEELGMHAVALATVEAEESGDVRIAAFFRALWAASTAKKDRPAGQTIAEACRQRAVPAKYEWPFAALLAFIDGAPPPALERSTFEARAVRRFVARGASPPHPEAAPEPVGRATVDVHGRFFRTPDGTRVELRRRPVLRRVLAALARREGAGAATKYDLIAEGWPDERILEGPAAHRLYMALTTLRQLGLRDHLVSDGEGYRLERVDVERGTQAP